MSPTLTAPVYRTIKLKDEKGRSVAFQVCLAPEGCYVKGPGDKQARGPIDFATLYAAACLAEASPKRKGK